MAKKKPKSPTTAPPFSIQTYLKDLRESKERTEGIQSQFVEREEEVSEQDAIFRSIYGEPREVTVKIGSRKRSFKVYPVMPQRWYIALGYASQGLLCHAANARLDEYLASQQLTRKELDKVPMNIWDEIGNLDGLPEVIPPPPKAHTLAQFGTNPICLDGTLLTKMDAVLQYVEASYQREDCGFRPPRLDGVAGTCKTQVNALIAQVFGAPLVKVAGERSDPLTVQMKFGRANDRLVTNAVEAAKQVVAWGALTSKAAERECFRTLRERGSYNRMTDQDYAKIAALEGLTVGEPYLAPNEYTFAKQYGGYLFLDEVNYFDPSIISILNNELENRAPRVVHDDLTHRVQVHPNYVVSAAQNPASVTYSLRDPLPFDLASRMVAIPEVPAPTADEIKDMLFFKFTGVQPYVAVNGVTKRFSPKDIGLTAKPYNGIPVINQLDPEKLEEVCGRLGKLHVAVYKQSDQGTLSRMHQCEPTKEIEMQVSEPNAFSKRNIYDDFCTILKGEFFRGLPKGPRISKVEALKTFVAGIVTAVDATYRSPNDFSRPMETEGGDRKKPEYVSAALYVDGLVKSLKLTKDDLEVLMDLKTPKVQMGPQSHETQILHALLLSRPEMSQEDVEQHMTTISKELRDFGASNPEFKVFLADEKLEFISKEVKPGEAVFSGIGSGASVAERFDLDRETSFFYYTQSPIQTVLVEWKDNEWKERIAAKAKQNQLWIKNTLGLEKVEVLPRFEIKHVPLPGFTALKHPDGTPKEVSQLSNSSKFIEDWANRLISTPDM